MKFYFLAQIEDLQRSLIGLESNDLLTPMHNSAVSLNGSTYDFIVAFKVDYDDFRVGIICELLANTNKVVGF